MSLKTCQHGDCLEDIDTEGVSVSLKTPTFYNEYRAGFCCAFHGGLSLLRLALDRKEVTADEIESAAKRIPAQWRVT